DVSAVPLYLCRGGAGPPPLDGRAARRPGRARAPRRRAAASGHLPLDPGDGPRDPGGSPARRRRVLGLAAAALRVLRAVPARHDVEGGPAGAVGPSGLPRKGDRSLRDALLRGLRRSRGRRVAGGPQAPYGKGRGGGPGGAPGGALPVSAASRLPRTGRPPEPRPVLAGRPALAGRAALAREVRRRGLA